MRSSINEKLNNKPSVTKSFGTANRVAEQQRRNSAPAQAKSSIDVGVSNPDPDMRKMLTAPMQGMVSTIQGSGIGLTGRVSINTDVGTTDPATGKPLLQTPGQPMLLYPASAGDTGLNTVFTRGGQFGQNRNYPLKLLTTATHSYTFGDTEEQGLTFYNQQKAVVVRNGTDSFLNIDSGSSSEWDQNSPIPPGMRYVELTDVIFPIYNSAPIGPGSNLEIRLRNLGISTVEEYYGLLLQLAAGNDPTFTDYDLFLPHDSLGHIRQNILTLPIDAFYHLSDFYNQDKYWTGECDDPLNWEDSWWLGLDIDPSGNTPRVDKAGLATYLQAHPNAQLR